MPEYIEREAVHRLIFDCKKYNWTSSISSESRVTVDTDDVNFGVDKIQAEDVVQVRHGLWKDPKDSLDEVVCTVCAKAFNIFDNCCETFYYCPNCGSKMDGEEE